MLLLLTSVYKKVSALALIALTLWLGGFGCSLCCTTGATDSCCLDSHRAPAQPTASNSGVTSCDSGPDECSCCKTSTADSNTSLTETAIRREDAIGCSLLPNRIEGVTAQVRVENALALQGGLPISLLVIYSPIRTKSLLETPPPLNRGGTYLRCCVLLI